MGHTLIEGETGEESNSPRERDGAGVSRRVWRVVCSLAARLLAAVAGVVVPAAQPTGGRTQYDRSTERPRSRDAVAIRPSGQARLESGPASPPSDQSTDHESNPEIAARIRGGKLRVYNTENDEAYIDSDVHERIQR